MKGESEKGQGERETPYLKAGVSQRNILRSRLHRLTYKLDFLIDELSDDELETTWSILQEVYYDIYVVKAIQEAKRNVQPGDTMNYEEAVRLLHLP
ncbi:hypothetical protein [Argonema galeatum]|uniref:hypothetical protein n=1 Tax=Argonema galeatum TaxID=2942762 RepID=UPI002012F6F4|nr:hypothetical protein [Argonema galeatum]MCL1465246.1 hypothetical protein [Argonema galeatum A003/A1]